MTIKMGKPVGFSLDNLEEETNNPICDNEVCPDCGEEVELGLEDAIGMAVLDAVADNLDDDEEILTTLAIISDKIKTTALLNTHRLYGEGPFKELLEQFENNHKEILKAVKKVILVNKGKQ